MNEISAQTQHLPGEIAETWIAAYTEEMLEAREEATIEAYTRVLEKFACWLSPPWQLRPIPSAGHHPHSYRGLS